ncbi:MAG: hypothetical protein AUJ85_07940 [Elusimicrobia bacterium CG1_02_37_114]|nr:MAG: hypothetical protein AUJ85_07940 [Elusimicrobia bacterium CG1_02_37_114]PIZ14143.1 MAG: hypothetical protein COY53_01245 [Elusimicrobia bacterium CG_4_10_14_0_8_um_filter_37_32]
MKRWVLVHFGFPAIALVGSVSSKLREKLECWFVDCNNYLTELYFSNSSRKRPVKTGRYSKGEVNCFLLLPHCIQMDDCEHRLVKTILNCAGCGKCKIAELVKFGEKYGIIIRVATGGRLAKKWVKEIKPDIVVAVACEKELSEGIVAVYPIPVIGIPNIRPEGYCVSTSVDVDKVQGILEKIKNVVPMNQATTKGGD